MSTSARIIFRREPPWWRRWLRRTAIVVLLVIAYFVVEQAVQRHQARRELAKAMAELDETDPRWRLAEIEEDRAAVPEKENSARVVVAARAKLPPNWPPSEPLTALGDVPPERQLPPALVQRLRTELAAARPALMVAAPLAEMPRGRHHIEYKRNVISTLLNDQQKTREVTALFGLDATGHAQANDPAAAMRACLAMLNTARSIGDEPLAISQLVRIAGVLVACKTIERVLAQTLPQAADLERLQKALAEEERFPAARIVARGERAAVHEIMNNLESGEESDGSGATGPGGPSWKERLTWPVTLTRLLQEHPQVLRLMTRQIEHAEAPLHEQAELEQDLSEEVVRLPTKIGLARQLVPALKLTTESIRRKRASLRCLVVLLACERYRLAHDKWPARLDDLVPTFLPEIPADPFDGKPIRFKLFNEGVVIYSVGVDAKDDGGVLEVEKRDKGPLVLGEPPARPPDLGYRLWDVSRRRPPAGKPQ